MIFLRYADVAVSKLYLEGDFIQRCKSLRVQELATSLESVGAIHPPIVRKSDWRVLCGRDRVAAHMVAGKKLINVKLVECDDLEAKKIELEENVRRRYDPKERVEMVEQLTELAKLTHDDLVRKPKPPRVPGRKGRGKSEIGRAREQVARVAGVTPDTIRKAEWEHEKKADILANPIRTLGMQLDNSYVVRVADVRLELEKAQKYLQCARAVLTKLLNDEKAPLQRARVERLREAVEEVQGQTKTSIPSCLCPGCKGLDGIQAKCPMCLGAGFITRGQEAGVPSLLWDEEAPLVQVDGRTVPVSEVAEPPQVAEEEWVF